MTRKKLQITNYKLQKTVSQSGQMLIIVLIGLTLIVINTLLIIAGSMTFSQTTKFDIQKVQATNLAEAGIDKAVASLNATSGTYFGETDTQFGVGTYDVTVANKDISTDIVTATGYVPNKANAIAHKTISINVTKGTGISFVYGMLIGTGGIVMANNAQINGSVYSNGNITGGNNELITGDVFVAGGTQPSADQQSDCSGASCTDYIFGKSVGGENRLDVAQSFKPTQTTVLNKVSLKLKKTGSPTNPTVRIMADSSGQPNKNSVLATGTLQASLVSSTYGFVDVTFAASPNLTANTKYWIMIAANSLDNSNYWAWSEDTLLGYSNGSPSWSPDWGAHAPIWTGIPGDLGFKTYMGGVATNLTMTNGSVIGGNAHINTISGVTINKDAYYQNIANSTVKGISYPGTSDPPPIAMPISTQNITDWQNAAAVYGTTAGNVTGCPATLGPGKIIGNVTPSNNCTITVTTPIWITGNMVNANSVIYKMDPSLGASSGVIIVDGTTTFANSDNILGTGQTGSYLTMLSTYNSSANGGTSAIDTGNSSLTGILYAPNGTVSLANNATFKEVVADKIIMGTSTVLTYDAGLISTVFSTGPGGQFTAIKGTYQIK